jgi:hypothetical protein
VRRATAIMSKCESEYLSSPTDFKRMCNYALYCHTVLLDYDRARNVYVHAMQVMEHRGPPVSFLLYAYAIFSFVSHGLDWPSVQRLVSRAQEAETKHIEHFKQSLQAQIFTRTGLRRPDDGCYEDPEETLGRFAATKQLFLGSVGDPPETYNGNTVKLNHEAGNTIRAPGARVVRRRRPRAATVPRRTFELVTIGYIRQAALRVSECVS